MNNELKRGRGRPKVGDGYTERFEMRLSEDEAKLLAKFEKETGYSKADIFRKAFRGYCAYMEEMNK